MKFPPEARSRSFRADVQIRDLKFANIRDYMEYTDKLIEHFRHPRNVGEIRNPDGVGRAGNPVCGDVLELYVKVKDNRITEIKFKTLGCAAAIATSSIITELAKDKTIEEALKISNQDVTESLGGVPVVKRHCSVLAEQALKAAINDYLQKRKG